MPVAGFQRPTDGGGGMALGLRSQPPAEGSQAFRRTDLRPALEELFALFLVYRVTVIGEGAEEEMLFRIEGGDGEPLQSQNARLTLEGFHHGDLCGVAADIEA